MEIIVFLLVFCWFFAIVLWALMGEIPPTTLNGSVEGRGLSNVVNIAGKVYPIFKGYEPVTVKSLSLPPPAKFQTPQNIKGFIISIMTVAAMVSNTMARVVILVVYFSLFFKFESSTSWLTSLDGNASHASSTLFHFKPWTWQGTLDCSPPLLAPDRHFICNYDIYVKWFCIWWRC
jgi:hypothetical protein